MRVLPLFAAVAVSTLFGAIPSWADTEIEGQGPGGAYYKIVVPNNWNRTLVIWNHGFSLGEIEPVDDIGPLQDIQLLEGYAVAASSFRLSGWALFKSDADLRELVAAFTAEVGAADQIILYGASLGGAVTASALERGNLGNVVGALTFCGAMAGSRNWDAALDLRLGYDLVCADMPDAAIPGAAKGLPRNSNWTDKDVERAVNACTGVDERRSRRTARQQQNLDRLLDLAQIPQSFLQTDMDFATQGMSDLVYDRQKLRGRIGTTNKKVDHGDREVNRGIKRVKGKKRFRRKLRKNFTPQGNVGNAKIISMHTDKDGLVLVENQSEYANVVPAQNLTTVIAVEPIPTHCVFTPGEILAGWEALRDWIDTGQKPTPLDIQETCKALPLVGGVCRIDPDFVVPDMDGRVRPR
jgi:pimeloyl-ACP methyl ester carboxylesterase